MRTDRLNQRLANVRARITLIEQTLEDNTLVTNVSSAAGSETVDRTALQTELNNLYREEEYLESVTNGQPTASATIDLSRS